LPDPRATVTDDWVRLTVGFDRGKLALVRAKHERLRRAESSARRMGRFAAELWIGCELIDRIRFDFPLLGAEPLAQKDKQSPAINFEQLGRYEAELWIPNSERATRLELRDRTRESDANAVVTLEWPLSADPTLAPPASRPLQ
jgi:hypothetical protein